MPWRMRLGDPTLFPVQAFFNAVGNGSFVQMVDCLTRGIGFTSDEAQCMFPCDLEPGDAPFEGVRFSIFEDEVVLPVASMRTYLRDACESYLESHPSERPRLEPLLARKPTE